MATGPASWRRTSAWRRSICCSRTSWGSQTKRGGGRLSTYIRRQQRPDGTWAIYYGGPPDLNATVEAYFALKLAGVSADEPAMRQARDFVLSAGGVPRTRIFTKIWLALFGQWDWRGVPVLPPELMFLPHWFPLNIYDFASWARATIVPMLIILSRAAHPCGPRICAVSTNCIRSRETKSTTHFLDLSDPLSWKGFFRHRRRCPAALRRASL